MTLESFLGYILSFGLGGAVVLFLLGYFLTKPESLILIGNRVYGLVSRRKRRARTAAKITELLNDSIFHLKQEMPTVVTESLSIKWIENGNDFAELNEGEVVLYIADDYNAPKVLVNATMQYVKNGINHTSRPYINRDLLESIDVTLAQRILLNQPNAFEYLQSQYVEPFRRDQSKREILDLAAQLDESGVLTRVILLEFRGLPRLAGERTPSDAVRDDTVAFSRFVRRIVQRDNEYVPLRYFGRYINSTLALVAEEETVRNSGVMVYQRNFRRDIEHGVRTIHLLARGMNNIYLVRGLSRWAIKRGFIRDEVVRSLYNEPTKRGRTAPAICITCYSNRTGVISGIDPVDELASTLAEIVPELASREVEITAIARQPNVRSKVVVRSTTEENIVSHFVGKKGENVDRLKEMLNAPSEEIDFIPWSPSSTELVKRAIYPLRDDEISEVTIDSRNGTAIVKVMSEDKIGFAVGKGGVNVRLAGEVTGYDIQVVPLVTPDERKQVIEAALREAVSAIKIGDIAIASLGYATDSEIKVFVKSGKATDPAAVCQTLSRGAGLSAKLKTHVEFLNWSDDLHERVLLALHPLDRTHIIEFSVIEERNLVKVEVDSYNAKAQAIGRRGCNVQAAEMLVGYRISVVLSD